MSKACTPGKERSNQHPPAPTPTAGFPSLGGPGSSQASHGSQLTHPPPSSTHQGGGAGVEMLHHLGYVPADLLKPVAWLLTLSIGRIGVLLG